MKQLTLAVALSLCSLPLLGAQNSNTQTQGGNLINIRVSRTTQAVNYRDRTSTKIDFQGTPLMARSQGEARVDARDGRVAIKAEFSDLQEATTFGGAYLTYVLWAISPEGRANNLGELFVENGKAKIEVTTKLQTFGMIVTAEPYFSVTYPSDIVVMENIVRKDTKGAVTAVDAKFDLLQRGAYDHLNLTAYTLSNRAPLSLYEARNVGLGTGGGVIGGLLLSGDALIFAALHGERAGVFGGLHGVSRGGGDGLVLLAQLIVFRTG
jgi:hypothetical protein